MIREQAYAAEQARAEKEFKERKQAFERSEEAYQNASNTSSNNLQPHPFNLGGIASGCDRAQGFEAFRIRAAPLLGGQIEFVRFSPLASHAEAIPFAFLVVRIGENLGDSMKAPKLGDVAIDVKATKRMRNKMAATKKVKITINIDQASLKSLRKRAGNTGVPYQRLLNQLLRQALLQEREANSRLDRLEKEIAKLKRMVAA